MTRCLVVWLGALPLGCPLLQDDDFVVLPPAEAGFAEAGGAPAAGSPEAGASHCDGENWSGRGGLPQPCEPKSVK
jgi:hypothetical protein